MKLSTLKKYLGVHIYSGTNSNVTLERLESYLKKYNFIQKGDVIFTGTAGNQKFNQNEIKQNLDFINKMTVSLENLAKSNNYLKLTEN
jgi:hypothetical protein